MKMSWLQGSFFLKAVQKITKTCMNDFLSVCWRFSMPFSSTTNLWKHYLSINLSTLHLWILVLYFLKQQLFQIFPNIFSTLLHLEPVKVNMRCLKCLVHTKHIEKNGNPGKTMSLRENKYILAYEFTVKIYGHKVKIQKLTVHVNFFTCKIYNV